MKRTLIALSLVAATLAGTAATAAPAGAGTETPTINIIFFSFRPNPLTVAPGTEVLVRNWDGRFFGEPHSVTSREFHSGVFTTGTRTIIAPDAPGTYGYRCIVHLDMRGTLIVQ